MMFRNVCKLTPFCWGSVCFYSWLCSEAVKLALRTWLNNSYENGVMGVGVYRGGLSRSQDVYVLIGDLSLIRTDTMANNP